VSGRLNRDADRYASVLKEHGMDLTAEESAVLKNVLLGSWCEPMLIKYLAHEVEDSDAYRAGDPASASLLDKCQRASYADLVAEVERLGH
jgi:hypothetical protein